MRLPFAAPIPASPLTNRNDSITPMFSLLPTIQDRDPLFAGLTVAVHQAIDAIAGLSSAQRTDLRRPEADRD
jgi:hypothetical protein